jgi:carbon storage regulator
MLVLTRKINQTIVIGGNIRVTTASIRNSYVRLAIDAPPEVHILREELVPIPADAAPAGASPPSPAYRSDRRRALRPRITRSRI